MKSQQSKKATPNKDIAYSAMWRARRKGWCKQQAQQEIERQRAIEELDKVLLRQFRAFI